MPGTPIAKAPDASNSPNPPSSVQPPDKHRKMAYTDIHCRSILAQSQIRLFSIHPDSNILPTHLEIISSDFQAIIQEFSKTLLTPSLSEL